MGISRQKYVLGHPLVVLPSQVKIFNDTRRAIGDFIPVEKVASLFLVRSVKRDLYSCILRIYNIGGGETCSLIPVAQHWRAV